MVSLALLGQYSSYVLPTMFMLGRRLYPGKNIPFGPWSLGRWGVPVNIATIAFSAITIGFNVLPPFFPVDATNMNYAGVVFGAALIIVAVLWVFMGQKHYTGPIKDVMQDRNIHTALTNPEAELHKLNARGDPA